MDASPAPRAPLRRLPVQLPVQGRHQRPLWLPRCPHRRLLPQRQTLTPHATLRQPPPRAPAQHPLLQLLAGHQTPTRSCMCHE